ncbi:MAG: hypothetical protein ACHQNV_05815 [Vicinamibacteria bacterium]
MLRATVRLAVSVAVASLFLRSWVWPLHGVIRGDLHGDSSLLTWNLWAMTESALRGQDPYRTSLLYAPVGANLATHTYGLGFLPIPLLCRALLPGDATWPIEASHLTIWACCALGLFLAYHALRALRANGLAAAAGAMAWTFAPVFRSRALETHLVAAAFLLPALTLALARLVDRPARSRAVVLGAILGGCVYFSEYYSAFLWLGALLLAGAVCIGRETRAEACRIASALGARGVAMGVGAFAVVAFPFLAHWASSDALPLNPEQAYFESANLAGLVVPDVVATPLYRHVPGIRPLGARVRRGIGGGAVFLGLPVMAGAALGLVSGDRRLRRLAWILTVVFLVLSLGPELKIFETNTRLWLPYRGLMELPPFEMARAPARLAAVGLWGLVGLMSLGLTRAMAALGRHTSWPAGAALGLVVLGWTAAENHGPTPVVDLFEPPAELSALGPGGVLNVPVSARDSLAMLLQMLHGRAIATGYVSRLSQRQADHVGRLDALLQKEPAALVSGLQSLGIGNAIVARGVSDAEVEQLQKAGLRVVDLRRLP